MPYFSSDKLVDFKIRFALACLVGILITVSYILAGWLLNFQGSEFVRDLPEIYALTDPKHVRAKYWQVPDFGYTGLLILMLSAWFISYFMMRKKLTVLEGSQREIRKLALQDPVTGLPNRGYFNELLDQSITYADRYKTKCTLLLLDLDNFKNMNDTLGHNAGDELLKAIGRRIQNSLRAHEVVSRIGGDEFAILLSAVHQQSEIAAIAKHVLSVVSEPVDIDGVTLVPSTSIGISIFPTDASDKIELFAHADFSLYKAKDIEKGTYYFFDDSMREEVAIAKKTEISLRKALENDELIVHYQPQVELRNGKIVGFEALARWNHPEYGLVGPGYFIKLAENRGLAKHVGNFVIDRVLMDRVRLKNMFDDVPRLAFNISPSHFKHPGFAESLIKRLEQQKICAGELLAEITEDCVLGRGTEKSHHILSDLRAAGVEISFDDFGTGYASLTHLRDLSIDEIKVDSSLIKSLLSSKSSDAIVQSIVDLANSLGLRVVAEGVEMREQMLALQELGCKYSQGYYFSHPVSFEKACELLKSRSIRHNIDFDKNNYRMPKACELLES